MSQDKPPAHLEPPAKPSAEEKRAMRIATGPQTGTNWRVVWAEISPPWSGLDDVLGDKGYRTRSELAPTVRGDANEEPRYAF